MPTPSRNLMSPRQIDGAQQLHLYHGNANHWANCLMLFLLPGLCSNHVHFGVDCPTLLGQSKVSLPKFLYRENLSKLGLTAKGEGYSVWQIKIKCCPL